MTLSRTAAIDYDLPQVNSMISFSSIVFIAISINFYAIYCVLLIFVKGRRGWLLISVMMMKFDLFDFHHISQDVGIKIDLA